jgi:hypothetical protein
VDVALEAEIVDADHVLVADAGAELGLALEALDDARVGGVVADGDERVVVEARGGVDGGVEAEVAGAGAAAT